MYSLSIESMSPVESKVRDIAKAVCKHTKEKYK